MSLYLIEIPHQTTTTALAGAVAIGCILSKFHIKPQLLHEKRMNRRVVSYRNSTSNHNFGGLLVWHGGLYLIEIPHQTTTETGADSRRLWLYLIEIPHQTTTCCSVRRIQ